MNPPISLSRILAPVEFSDPCHGAARHAEALARQFHAQLTLLHIVAPPYIAYGDVGAFTADPDFLDRQWDLARTELDGFLTEPPEDLRVERILLDGDPATRIVEFADTGRFDLIVMPTHAYGPVRRFLLGSVTAKVLHDANTPVWTGGRLKDAPDWPDFTVRRIVCALDLGPQSCAALRWAAGMAQAFSAEMTILHALPASTVSAEQEARQRITQMLQQIQVEAEVQIVVGDAPQAISKAASDTSADLLVIGRSHRSGVLGRLRATAYAILREAPCPVASI